MNQGAHHRLLTPTRSRLSPTSRSTSRTTVANTGWLIARCRRMPVRKPPALSRHPRAAMLRRGPVINRNPTNPKIWGICPAIKHRDTAEMKVLFGTCNTVIKITMGARTSLWPPQPLRRRAQRLHRGRISHRGGLPVTPALFQWERE
jgi:hypothetical protein